MGILISEIADGLEFIDEIWYSKGKIEISYPMLGNNNSFELEEQGYWFHHRNDILIEVIKKYAIGNSFFDLGGGNGYVTKALLVSGFESFLLEPGADGIANAKRRGIKNLICSSFQDACFKNNSISNAGLFDVVEHIDDAGLFLKLINKSLIKGGVLFITVPSYTFLWSGDDIFAGHFKRYSIKSFSKLLEENGFTVIYSNYFFSFLVPLIFFFKSIPYRIIGYSQKNSFKKEHIPSSTLLKKIIKFLTDFELNLIKGGHKLLFGSSCILVAKKTYDDSIQ